MKILVHLSDREHIQNILIGWTNALVDSGYEVKCFNASSSPLFREIELFRPDLLILEAVSVNRAIKKAVEQSGIKTIILTDRKLLAHQSIPNASVVSYKSLDNCFVSPIGIDFVQYRNPEKDNFYKCGSALITNKKVDSSFGGVDRIYSNIPQNSPLYAGKIRNKKKIYSNTATIFVQSEEENTDWWNMVFCGATLHDVGEIGPKETYHHRLMKLFAALNLDNSKLEAKFEEIKNAKDWSAVG